MRKNSSAGPSEYFAEPLLVKREYKLQINASPQSTTSDQREYKGPKRVDVFDEHDIEQMVRDKRAKIYSQTPSPPHSKKTSPHRVKMKKFHQRNGYHHHQRNMTRNMTANCEDSYNLNDEGVVVVVGVNGDMNGHHRHTSTKYVVDMDGMGSSYKESISVVTDDTYYDNLKLKHIKKKSVDKNRLMLLLQNLPGDKIIDESSSEEEMNHRLHTENHVLTFI